jgi:threonine/homoserine/homoserine lactone efflux protein
MIDLTLLFAFIVAATILTITPGVDTAMVLRAATVDGRRAAVMASAGITLGCLIWGGATVPLGRLLRRPKAVQTLDRLTGGVFMAFGIRLATSSAR